MIYLSSRYSFRSFIGLLQAVFAGALGVQSKGKRAQDFKQLQVLPIVVAGIIFTLLFILSLILIINWITT